ncbi:MAG: tryptophan--tRNA ligase [Patescibacteria group bacterium]|nr:tryptophan--tRNA ligase [Patescibacteria group bacterium]
MKKEIIVAGIRASGKLHIGNYLGALKQFVELQNDPAKDCYFFIADLHGLTTPFEPSDLSKTILDVTAAYLAAGIDPDKCVFFPQSQVLEHAQLAWIFNCLLPLGELERMTQYKDKARQHKENINAGLLTYPALMAADILMYKGEAVPVGEDQVQHVELARVVARKFNNRFGKTFPEPKTFLREPLRIMSLADPDKKMSKTPHQSLRSGAGQAGDDGCIFLDDTPLEIHRKLKKAVTASESGKKSPGEENLMLLLAHFGKTDGIRHFTEAQNSGTLKYSELKQALAESISEYFTPFREKKKELLARPEYLARVLAQGAAKAAQIARETMLEVKEKIGLV